MTTRRAKNKSDGLSRECTECGRMMAGRAETYRYIESGLKSVVLVGINVFHCECGAIEPEIPAMAQLHRGIAMNLVKKSSLLSAEEIRFLRKMGGFSAVQFSRVMGVTHNHLSKLENGHRRIGKNNDRLLRLICLCGILQQLARKDGLVDKVAEVARENISSIDLPLILESIQETEEGPMPIRIDPSQLAGLGNLHQEPTKTNRVQ